MSNVLDHFLPAVRAWFQAQYPAPTPPQEMGWPAIQRGEHTLILSPTGSGKTMTAFLWGINTIFAELATTPDLSGVQLLYISPLKALNNDIERNLRAPLAGIRQVAQRLGQELPPLRVAVRTGDTPSSERQRMVAHPPHILITTPESLYLILTSPRACDILRTVKTVIVDEIHTLCGNKRGVHMTLSLERLALKTGRPFQRIGLSATQRPLEEVACFLGGQDWQMDAQGQEQLVQRPVTIVDAGTRKKLDLKVITVVPDLRRLPGDSIWPALIPQVLDDVRRHHTTLIFSNSRRGAERAADRLNEQYAMEETEEFAPGTPDALLQDGVPKGQGMFGTGRAGGPFRVHHGSISKEARLELEQQLKAGQLPALIGTSSLELGIDIGSVDAVVQLQSPRGIARGLQRVGRAGHLVGQTSVGRIYATFREDLLDAGAVAHGMLLGDVEPVFTPQNCLDVLAQQVVALVSMEPWDVTRLHRLVCQAYGYGKLTREAFHAVLDMLTGRYPSESFRELRPRILWDRVHDTLAALPGSRMLATNNSGTIPDRGLFRVYLPDGKTLLGTLDEEFVYETRTGDVFTLGGNTWRAMEIKEDRILVTDAAGSMPRMPFWKGDAPHRDYYMGLRLGAFRRLLAERVAALPILPDDAGVEWPPEAQPVIQWLADEYVMDESSARNAILYVKHQMEVMGAISSDKSVIVEVFTDALGDPRMAIHSCFGGRVNSAWGLALAHALRERLHMQVEAQVNDDGILFRFLEADREPPTDIVRSVGPDEARERLLHELPNSALFGSQFRMNAARALLLPGARGMGRTPFWLQRLRAKDLLAVAKGFENFPLIAETYRDCLSDVLDLPHLVEVLEGIRREEIRVVEAETVVPSPVAGSLLFDFIAIQMYEGDLPKVDRQMQALAINRELLGQLLDEGMLPDLLRPEAVRGVAAELQHLAEGYRARSSEELALVLHELGDLSTEEVAARCLGDGGDWLAQLAGTGRVLQVTIPTSLGVARRWIAAEDYRRYRDAWNLPATPPILIPAHLLEPYLQSEEAQEALLRVWMRTHGPLTQADILGRYAFPAPCLEETLRKLVDMGELANGHLSPGAAEREWCDRRVLERIHRRTLSLLRKEIRPVDWPAYADFTLRWQNVHPTQRRRGLEGLTTILQQLRGLPAPAVAWERDLLPLRLGAWRSSWLDDLCTEGDLVWVASGEGDIRRAQLRFLFRGEGASFLQPEPAGEALNVTASHVWAFLKGEGACYARDIQRALDLSGGELDASLVDLLLAGIVTNDHLQALRQVLAGEITLPGDTTRGVSSSLQAELSAWRSARPTSGASHRPSPEQLRRARREATQRVTPQQTRWSGRWSLVHRIGVWGAEVSPEERGLRQARQLLQRYGIVARECLVHEDSTWEWAALYRHLERLELRGEVRRGYFVRGLSGAQFALPEAVERLRAWNSTQAEGPDALCLLNACDPANVYSTAFGSAAQAATETAAPTETVASDTSDLSQEQPALRGLPRVSRLPTNYLILQAGIPLLTYEHGGSRWTVLPQITEGSTRRAVQLLLEHLTREGGLCTRPRRVLVAQWNGVSPVGSAAQPLLESLGFRREPPTMVWDGM